MSAVLRPETQDLVDQVEKRTGLPVQVIPIKDLPVAATVTMSPHATDSYVVRYRSGLSFKDYAVAFQCGHVLRVLSLPEHRRVQFATNSAAMAWGERLVRGHLKGPKKSSFPESVIEGFVRKLVGGLFTQLHSIPVGMRVDAWLAAEYPTLSDLQAESLAVQQREALVSLSPEIKQMVPEEIVAGSILLNVAYALFCDRLLGSVMYQVPYVSAGFRELGEALLAIYDETPSDPSSDVTLVDRWATEIGLSGKYEWVPFPSRSSQVS